MAAPRRAAFAEESAEVEVLFANLEKLNGLTKKIQGSMNRLETSGSNIETSIRPIYGNTRRLQVIHKNIDNALKVIDNYRAPLESRHKEEDIIRDDPRRVGIKEYIRSMDRAERNLAGLRQTNLSANQNAIKEMSALVKYGVRQLEEVFKQCLLSDGGATPIETLTYVLKDKPFPRLPSPSIPQLQTIAVFLSASQARNLTTSPNADHPTHRLYSDIRGAYIARSLSNCATATSSTLRRQNADAIYQRGTCGIEAYAKALEGMVAAEVDNTRMVFPREEASRVLVGTVRSAVGEFERTMEMLNAHVKANAMTDVFLGFEIIEVVGAMTSRMSAQVVELKKPLNDVLAPIRSTAKTALAKMVEDTKSRGQSLAVLAPEGNASQLTVDIMTRLQILSSYLGPVTTLLTSIGDGGWGTSSPASSTSPSLRSFDVNSNGPNDGTQIFAHYCLDTLESLVATLDSRARLLLKSQGVQAVFMCNNVSIIDNMIRSSDLADLLGPQQTGRIDMWRSKHLKLYLAAWTPASQQLLDVQYTNRTSRPQSSGLDSASVVKSMGPKERDNIKEKFKMFNAVFDELVAKHKSYKMEKDVRIMLGKEVQRVIEPLYGRFWDRYHEVDKGKGKYVRYDKGGLAAVFASM